MPDLETVTLETIVEQLNKLKQPARERIVFFLLAKYNIIAGFDVEDKSALETEEDVVEKP